LCKNTNKEKKIMATKTLPPPNVRVVGPTTSKLAAIQRQLAEMRARHESEAATLAAERKAAEDALLQHEYTKLQTRAAETRQRELGAAQERRDEAGELGAKLQRALPAVFHDARKALENRRDHLRCNVGKMSAADHDSQIRGLNAMNEELTAATMRADVEAVAEKILNKLSFRSDS
jgi:hypothetical protein